MAYLHLAVAALVVALALPLIFRKVKMNGIYGIRIPESFRSEERWYEINRFGGILLFAWGLGIGASGVIGVMLPRDQWTKYNLISGGMIVGGLVLITVAIFVYAARTRRD